MDWVEAWDEFVLQSCWNLLVDLFDNYDEEAMDTDMVCHPSFLTNPSMAYYIPGSGSVVYWSLSSRFLSLLVNPFFLV
jgi:hypothetical protein